MKQYLPLLVLLVPILVGVVAAHLKRKWLTVVGLLFINVVVWISVVYHGRLILNVSDSNSHYILLLEPNTPVSKGDYIVWDARHPYHFNGEPFSIHKKIECMPGQKLEVDQSRNYHCDGRFLGQAKTKAIDGRPLTNFVYNGVIPEGKYFTIGHRYRKVFSITLDDSFDSRYLGFVDIKEVKGVAKPIL